MKSLNLASVVTVTLSLVSTQTLSSPLEDCLGSVSIEGSFFAGRIFKGKAFIPKGNQQEHLKKVAKTLVQEGLTINTMDKDLGIVTASYSKKAIGGKTPVTTTFSMTFDQRKDGLDASATLSTPGGVTTNEETNKKDMCGLLVQP